MKSLEVTPIPTELLKPTAIFVFFSHGIRFTDPWIDGMSIQVLLLSVSLAMILSKSNMEEAWGMDAIFYVPVETIPRKENDTPDPHH